MNQNYIVKYKSLFIVTLIVLFTFQEFLSKLLPIFSYIDELPFLLLLVHLILYRKDLKFVIENNKMYLILLSVFIISGLIGNLIYHYQPIKLVLIDLMTNLKFYCAIWYFYYYIGKIDLGDQQIQKTAKLLTLFLMVFFIVDRIFNIFPGQIRFGIRSAALMYGHPTYLAGICAFLISILTYSDPKKNFLYICMDLIILIFTLRSKAIASAVLYLVLLIFIKRFNYKVKLTHLIFLSMIGFILAWSKIQYYFIDLGGQSARSVMLITSFLIIKDYFPFGTGFGTFGSHVASAQVHYSPVYVKYGFEKVSELSNSTIGTFFDDQFWPIIFGQTGVIGTICYVMILFCLFKRIQKVYEVSLNKYIICLFILFYLLISSVAEPAFNNAIAIPFTMVLASCFQANSENSEY